MPVRGESPTSPRTRRWRAVNSPLSHAPDRTGRRHSDGRACGYGPGRGRDRLVESPGCELQSRTTRPPRASTTSRPDDVVRAPVGALDEHVRLNGADDGVRCVLVEDDRPRPRSRAPAALPRAPPPGRPAAPAPCCPDRAIGVDADDQRVAKSARVCGGSGRARVQQIEDSVREHHRRRRGADAPRQKPRPGRRHADAGRDGLIDLHCARRCRC